MEEVVKWMSNLSSETHYIYLGSLKNKQPEAWASPSQILFHNPPSSLQVIPETSVHLCSAFISSSKDVLYELSIREIRGGRENISIKHTKFQQM